MRLLNLTCIVHLTFENEHENEVTGSMMDCLVTGVCLGIDICNQAASIETVTCKTDNCSHRNVLQHNNKWLI